MARDQPMVSQHDASYHAERKRLISSLSMILGKCIHVPCLRQSKSR